MIPTAAEDQALLAIGLMSGTSADGITAALVEISPDGPRRHWRLIAHQTRAYAPEVRQRILAACSPDTGTVDRICALDFELAERFAAAALGLCADAGVPMARVAVIGSHGQTVWHIPGQASLQIGNASVVAERTGCDVVSDFRARDIAAGGQGAPLVPYIDYLLLGHASLGRVAQNIGGIGNATYLPPGAGPGDVIAFDTGPGNMVIDAICEEISGGAERFDRDGRRAVAGRVDGELLAELLTHSFFAKRPPRSTGREEFGRAYALALLAKARARGLSDDDAVATATRLTVASIVGSYRDHILPRGPVDQVIVSGGGAHNQTLVRWLSEELGPAEVIVSDRAGVDGDAKEAIAFAILAAETLAGRPGNLPAATGAAHQVILGSLTRAGGAR